MSETTVTPKALGARTGRPSLRALSPGGRTTPAAAPKSSSGTTPAPMATPAPPPPVAAMAPQPATAQEATLPTNKRLDSLSPAPKAMRPTRAPKAMRVKPPPLAKPAGGYDHKGRWSGDGRRPDAAPKAMSSKTVASGKASSGGSGIESQELKTLLRDLTTELRNLRTAMERGGGSGQPQRPGPQPGGGFAPSLGGTPTTAPQTQTRRSNAVPSFNDQIGPPEWDYVIARHRR